MGRKESQAEFESAIIKTFKSAVQCVCVASKATRRKRGTLLSPCINWIETPTDCGN